MNAISAASPRPALHFARQAFLTNRWTWHRVIPGDHAHTIPLALAALTKPATDSGNANEHSVNLSQARN